MKVTDEEWMAAFAAAAPPGSMFSRELVPDPGNPGGCDPFGGWEWPPDFRWETDDEFRARIKATMGGAQWSGSDHPWR